MKNPSPQPPPRSGEGEPDQTPPSLLGKGAGGLGSSFNPSPKPPPRSGEGEPDFSAGAEKPMPPVANVIVGQRVEESKVARAKELRREMTPAEKAVWQRLRRNQLGGLHFRRQQVLYGFIADFYCHAAGLVV